MAPRNSSIKRKIDWAFILSEVIQLLGWILVASPGKTMTHVQTVGLSLVVVSIGCLIAKSLTASPRRCCSCGDC